MRNPSTYPKTRNVDHEDEAEDCHAEPGNESPTVGDPCCIGTERVAQTRGNLNTEIRNGEHGPGAEVPRTDESREGADRVLGPLINTPLEWPNSGAILNHTRDGKEQQQNSQQPRYDMSRTLTRGDPGP